MDKSLYYFKFYLEKLESNITKSLEGKKDIEYKNLKRQQVEVRSLLNDIELLEHVYDKSINYLLFNDFKLLSIYLESSDLSIKDKFNMLCLAIKFNTRPLASEGLLNFNNAIKLSEQCRDNVEFKEKTDKIIQNGRHRARTLTIAQNVQYFQNVWDYYKSFYKKNHIYKEHNQPVKHSVLLSECSIFDMVILKNKHYDEKCINMAITSLKRLNVSESLIEIIREYLVANKKEKRVESKIILSSGIELVEEEKEEVEETKVIKNQMSNEEYHQLKKQILMYYDIDNKEFINTIPYEKIVYIASLLFKLEYNEKDVYTFMKKSKSNLDIEKPVRDYSNLTLSDIYTLLSNKFNYYAQRIEELDLENFINFYNVLYNCYDSKDYEFWFNAWLNEIYEILAIIGTNYDYEIDKALSLSKE